MALLTEFASFFASPFGEKSVTDELNVFLRSHRIINVEKKLIDSERGTGWVFLVEYGSEVKPAQSGGNPRIDYRELLKPEEYTMFDKLRTLRKEIAEKAGVPVYTVFTNDQLAAMVKKPPLTTKDILAISGVGDARVKQYGETFVSFFKNLTQEPPQNNNGQKLFGTAGLPQNEKQKNETSNIPF
jgi:superfamily II DNA helicase RecQ